MGHFFVQSQMEAPANWATVHRLKDLWQWQVCLQGATGAVRFQVILGRGQANEQREQRDGL